MAATWTKAVLFVSSFSPLLLVFALLDSFGRGPATIVCLCLAVAGPILLYLVLRLARRVEAVPLVAASNRRRDADVLAYVATYLIPFLAVNAMTLRSRLAVGVFIALIALFYIRGEMYFLNPLLGVVGYRVFEVQTAAGSTVVLITKRRHIGDQARLRLVPLADYIYWEPEHGCPARRRSSSPSTRERQLVSSRYSIDLVLTMHDVDAFHEQVSAYPAITVIRNGAQGPAVAADTTRDFGPRQAGEFRAWAMKPQGSLVTKSSYQAARLPHWYPGDDSWPAASSPRLAVLEDLSDRFQLLEDQATSTRVGIGIATGADKVFIALDRESVDVEGDRLLPLVMVRDVTSGALDWHGAYLVNPWNARGDLADLADYPRLKRYFHRHRAALRNRYVASKQPSRWYKTIDKVDHQLTARPKLLLPDMKTTIQPVLDPGGLYPHHNLYYIVSDVWDLRVLGGLLLSKVAEAFVAAYGVKMRGGTLRFQAQYLRKIRVPNPVEMSQADRAALADAFDRRDVQAATQAALSAYGLTELPD